MNGRLGSLATAIAALALPALLVSCSTAPTPREFTIVGTADLQGQLDPYETEFDDDGDGVVEATSGGGIARIATIIREILYFEIQHLNKFGLDPLDALCDASRRIRELVANGNESGFVELMQNGRSYMDMRG